MSGENGSASGLGPTNETSCYEELDSIQYKIAAALRASVGLFSFFCCLGVVFVLVLYKKYKFFTQRLILYLTIAALVHSISYTLARVNYYTPRPIEDPYCYFGGLLNHYTAAVELLNIWCITFNLFVNTIFNKRTEKLEVIYFLISYFLPVTWFWLPLWKRAYGTAGPWCGIRTVDANCNPFPFGIWVQFGIWYIPLYVSLTIIFFATILIAIKAVRDSRKWRGKFDPTAKWQSDRIEKEVKPLIWYPVVYLALNVFSLISQIYNAVNPDNPSIALFYLRLLSSPFRGAFIALVYALDSETRRRLNCRQLRNLCKGCCQKKGAILEYQVVYSEFTDSYQLGDHDLSSPKKL